MHKRITVIVPFVLPWDWSADYQRQTCIELAKQYSVVAYIQNDARFIGKQKPGARKYTHKNIRFYQPTYIIPFRRFVIIDRLNQLLNIVYLCWVYGRWKHTVILWIFDPLFWFYPLARWGYARCISLYDCVDYAWNIEKPLQNIYQAMEAKLLRHVNYFFVNSHVLYRLHSPVRKPDAVVPQGFRWDEFRRVIPRMTPAIPGTKPVIGYIGAIDDRFDFHLVRELVKNHPQWHFIIWGPIQSIHENDRQELHAKIMWLTRYANVTYGYSKDTKELPPIISKFDVGIIPYVVTHDIVRYGYPMKLFEYYYVGKPVISSDIEELRRHYPYVTIATTCSEWASRITEILSQKWPQKYQAEQRKLAINNSWSNKVHTILTYVI